MAHHPAWTSHHTGGSRQGHPRYIGAQQWRGRGWPDQEISQAAAHRLTQSKSCVKNTQKFFPIDVPGVSSCSSASSSSTSLPQDSSSTSPRPARLRSDDTHYQAPGNRGDPPYITKQKKKKGNNQATSSRLRDLQEWLTEVEALANSSHDSDSERPTKVASRKHSIYTHFTKDRNCEICKRTKFTRALAGSALAKQYVGLTISVT